MISVHGIGPLWAGVYHLRDEPLPLTRYHEFGVGRRVWFREIDPPYRHGVGVRITIWPGIAIGFGVCRRDRDGRDDYTALEGHDIPADPPTIRKWGYDDGEALPPKVEWGNDWP